MNRIPLRRMALLLTAATCTAVLAGCASSGGPTSSGGHASSAGHTSAAISAAAGTVSPATTATSAAAVAATTSASTSAHTPAQLAAVLEAVRVKSTDLPAGYTVQLYPGGDEVTDEVTLDNCGFSFTSEAHRVARRQYGILTKTGQDTGLSNEVVAYDSTASAELALAQWTTAAKHCPTTPVKSGVAGVPDMRIKVTTVKRLSAASLSLSDNVFTTEQAMVEKKPLYLGSALQVHGRVLDIVWSEASTALATSELAAQLELAAVTGKRLAAEPVS